MPETELDRMRRFVRRVSADLDERNDATPRYHVCPSCKAAVQVGFVPVARHVIRHLIGDRLQRAGVMPDRVDLLFLFWFVYQILASVIDDPVPF